MQMVMTTETWAISVPHAQKSASVAHNTTKLWHFTNAEYSASAIIWKSTNCNMRMGFRRGHIITIVTRISHSQHAVKLQIHLDRYGQTVTTMTNGIPIIQHAILRSQLADRYQSHITIARTMRISQQIYRQSHGGVLGQPWQWWREFPAVSKSSRDAVRSSAVGWDVEVPCHRTEYQIQFAPGPTRLVQHMHAPSTLLYLALNLFIVRVMMLDRQHTRMTFLHSEVHWWFLVRLYQMKG